MGGARGGGAVARVLPKRRPDLRTDAGVAGVEGGLKNSDAAAAGGGGGAAGLRFRLVGLLRVRVFLLGVGPGVGSRGSSNSFPGAWRIPSSLSSSAAAATGVSWKVTLLARRGGLPRRVPVPFAGTVAGFGPGVRGGEVWVLPFVSVLVALVFLFFKALDSFRAGASAFAFSPTLCLFLPFPSSSSSSPSPSFPHPNASISPPLPQSLIHLTLLFLFPLTNRTGLASSSSSSVRAPFENEAEVAVVGAEDELLLLGELWGEWEEEGWKSGSREGVEMSRVGRERSVDVVWERG